MDSARRRTRCAQRLSRSRCGSALLILRYDSTTGSNANRAASDTKRISAATKPGCMYVACECFCPSDEVLQLPTCSQPSTVRRQPVSGKPALVGEACAFEATFVAPNTSLPWAAGTQQATPRSIRTVSAGRRDIDSVRVEQRKREVRTATDYVNEFVVVTGTNKQVMGQRRLMPRKCCIDTSQGLDVHMLRRECCLWATWPP